MTPARFTRRARLRSPGDFKAVLQGGRRLQEPLLTAACRRNELGSARLGLAISRKAAPLAVARNRVKRQVRESFRVNRARLPPLDIVVLAKTGCADAATAVLRTQLEKLWNRIAEQWARS